MGKHILSALTVSLLLGAMPSTVNALAIAAPAGLAAARADATEQVSWRRRRPCCDGPSWNYRDDLPYQGYWGYRAYSGFPFAGSYYKPYRGRGWYARQFWWW